MYAPAKRGVAQSHTYFTWRNSKSELQSYMEELTRPPVSEFFQPNFWPNTPDIVHKTPQEGGRPVFNRPISFVSAEFNNATEIEVSGRVKA